MRSATGASSLTVVPSPAADAIESGRRAGARAPPSTTGRAGASGRCSPAGRSRRRRRPPRPRRGRRPCRPAARPRRARVLERVVQRLLRDAQQLAVAADVRGRHAVELEPDLGRPGLHPAQHLDVLAQRRREAVALELGRPQLEDEVAQLLQRLLRQRAQRVHLLPRGLDVDVEQLPADSAVSDSANSFCEITSCSSSASRLRSSRIESSRVRSYRPRVRDRDRGVRGQQLDQLLVGLRELVGPSLSVR